MSMSRSGAGLCGAKKSAFAAVVTRASASTDRAPSLRGTSRASTEINRACSYGAVATFDAERVTARCRGVHVDIIHSGIAENFLDDSFHFFVRHIFLREKPSAASVALEGTRTATQFIGESGILDVAIARLSVDVHGTGQRQRLDPCEAIVCE